VPPWRSRERERERERETDGTREPQYGAAVKKVDKPKRLRGLKASFMARRDTTHSARGARLVGSLSPLTIIAVLFLASAGRARKGEQGGDNEGSAVTAKRYWRLELERNSRTINQNSLSLSLSLFLSLYLLLFERRANEDSEQRSFDISLNIRRCICRCKAAYHRHIPCAVVR